MLHQNRTLWTQYPLRQSGGAAAGLGAASRMMWQTPNKFRNRDAGFAGLSQWNGWPIGYRGTYALIQPTHTGGLACTGGRVAGVGTVSNANLAGARNGGATIAGVGALTSVINGEADLTATIAGIGALTAGITGRFDAYATLTGYGALTNANLDAIADLVATLGGLGDITDANLAGGLNAVATIAGSGDLIAAINAVADLAATLAGTCSLTAQLAAAISMTASLVGTGSLTGTIVGAGLLTSTLTGTGALTNADLEAVANMVAALAGTGAITNANLAGGMDMSANLAGVGQVSAALLTAVGNLSAAINIGAKPSADEIASAVWMALAASYNWPLTMGNKLNSAADPWVTPLPGMYLPGSAGSIVGTIIQGGVQDLLIRLTIARATSLDLIPGIASDATLIRKIMRNRLDMAPGAVGNWILYDDDSLTVLLTFDVSDATGGPVAPPAGAPARRSRGV